MKSLKKGAEAEELTSSNRDREAKIDDPKQPIFKDFRHPIGG